MLRTIILLYCLFSLCMSCTHTEENPKRPGEKLTGNDMILQIGYNYMNEESRLFQFLAARSKYIHSILSIAVDPGSETVFFLDAEGYLVSMDLNGNPNYLLNLKGKGPGEVEYPWKIHARNKRIFILDLSSNKISIFDEGGRWLKDLVFENQFVHTFEVDNDDRIIIPDITSADTSAHLFYLYDFTGKVVRTFGIHSVIDLENSNSLPVMDIAVSPLSDIVLALKSEGIFYFFSNDGVFHGKSDIFSGPEWTKRLAVERKMRKDPTFRNALFMKIDEIAFDHSGNFYADWSGTYNKAYRTLLVRYDKRGKFTGRVLIPNSDQLEGTLHPFSK